MSKLDDCFMKISNLLSAAQGTRDTYLQTRQLLEAVDTDPSKVDVSSLGLRLEIGGVSIPLPVTPELTPQLGNHLEGAANKLGHELSRLWAEILVVAQDAVAHCQAGTAAAQQAQAQATQPPLAASQPLPPAAPPRPPGAGWSGPGTAGPPIATPIGTPIGQPQTTVIPLQTVPAK